jgi:hypothetical protein
MGQFLQQLINGIQIGSIYALIALGYTMVYGIVRLINFAHADIFMVGAYMGFFLAPVMAKVFGGAFIPTIIAAMLITGLLGFVMEKLAYRPLRYKSRLSALITALGVSLFLENFCAMPFVFGPTFRKFPDLIETRPIPLPVSWGLSVSNILLLDVGVSVGLMILLFWFVNKTLIGQVDSQPHGHQHRRCHQHSLYRWSSVGWCRRDPVRDDLRHAGVPIPGNMARTQGVHCRCPGRHRQHPGRRARSVYHGHLGGICDVDRL